MRDIIWTLILVWLIYKIAEIFRNSGSKKSTVDGNDAYSMNKTKIYSQNETQKDIKGAIHKHLNKAGEYVDFEELK